ncbi:MAG: hypothetical protein IPL74_00630 [Bacteroidetes bacterium]|nr:hypothetical protein [Bacteroidota bacterium]
MITSGKNFRESALANFLLLPAMLMQLIIFVAFLLLVAYFSQTGRGTDQFPDIATPYFAGLFFKFSSILILGSWCLLLVYRIFQFRENGKIRNQFLLALIIPFAFGAVIYGIDFMNYNLHRNELNRYCIQTKAVRNNYPFQHEVLAVTSDSNDSYLITGQPTEIGNTIILTNNSNVLKWQESTTSAPLLYKFKSGDFLPVEIQATHTINKRILNRNELIDEINGTGRPNINPYNPLVTVYEAKSINNQHCFSFQNKNENLILLNDCNQNKLSFPPYQKLFSGFRITIGPNNFPGFRLKNNYYFNQTRNL